MHALIRVWTGTGNTGRAARVLAESLEAAGWTASLAVVRWDTPPPSATEIEGSDLVVLGCPALGFSAPVHFLRWLDRWPRVSRGRVALLAAVGAVWSPQGPVPGWSGALLGQLEGRARRLGLSVVSTRDFSYPVSWTQLMPPPSSDAVAALRDAADAEVRLWAQALASGTADSRVAPAGRRAILPVGLLFRTIARRFLGKLYSADDTCTSCGLCARTCPAGVIQMVGGRPRWSWDCDACNRCLNRCPPAAIQVTLGRLVFHGGGNLALTVAAVLAGSWGWFPALALYGIGTALQLTVGDLLWCRLESTPALRRALTWGWTRHWGRYR